MTPLWEIIKKHPHPPSSLGHFGLLRSGASTTTSRSVAFTSFTSLASSALGTTSISLDLAWAVGSCQRDLGQRPHDGTPDDPWLQPRIQGKQSSVFSTSLSTLLTSQLRFVSGLLPWGIPSCTLPSPRRTLEGARSPVACSLPEVARLRTSTSP